MLLLNLLKKIFKLILSKKLVLLENKFNENFFASQKQLINKAKTLLAYFCSLCTVNIAKKNLTK